VRRIAEGILAIGAVEADAARRQAIDVWSAHHWVAIAADAIVEIVGGDEGHIQLARSRGGSGAAKGRESSRRRESVADIA
jgi:anti-sigma factor RsiW